MELKRVVVTGLGALTPLGNNVEEYWNNLLKGVSGSAPITHFDASKFKTRFACELKGFNEWPSDGPTVSLSDRASRSTRRSQ